jgi:hypothetical protein
MSARLRVCVVALAVAAAGCGGGGATETPKGAAETLKSLSYTGVETRSAGRLQQLYAGSDVGRLVRRHTEGAVVGHHVAAGEDLAVVLWIYDSEQIAKQALPYTRAQNRDAPDPHSVARVGNVVVFFTPATKKTAKARQQLQRALISS